MAKKDLKKSHVCTECGKMLESRGAGGGESMLTLHQLHNLIKQEGALIVSEDTLNPKHLVAAFSEYICVENAEDGFIVFRDTVGNHAQTSGGLFEILEEQAPDGYVFSVHPDDGACFGYWPVDMMD